MKPAFLRIASLSLLFAFLFAMIPVAVSAQTVVSVTPTQVVNDVDNTITISGTGFDNTAVVSLGTRALATSFVDAQTVTAIVPAGTAPGPYEITVSLASGPLTGFANLNVIAPPPTATSVPAPVVRPQIGVEVYRTKPQPVQYGQDFKLTVKLRNEGQAQAFNVQAIFTSTDYLPTRNGGVEIVGDLLAGNSITIEQPMVVGNLVYGFVSVEMNLSY